MVFGISLPRLHSAADSVLAFQMPHRLQRSVWLTHVGFIEEMRTTQLLEVKTRCPKSFSAVILIYKDTI